LGWGEQEGVADGVWAEEVERLTTGGEVAEEGYVVEEDVL
jgi:hypothetical protein